ncbi:LytTR family DNA-binding domain-containing protein [Undibacterium sp. TS12]|uniref:LytR/AlgR family response regulator transcription factor n=1 Tax=Undibacterium sp. TS12 TaxID=2908202 RepID=UPI001F4CA398|nr:LytTR family DNA-binding domain-containing protein [Undibacterium sp. TS12]MCH8617961.1 LytTR family DNA-binding domain-containing protein [Undibacterium sp. TS12]
MSMKILIVDDEAYARDKLRRLVAEHVVGATVTEARDGREALDCIRVQQPDLVFLDIQMPEMDGVTVASQLSAPLPLIIFVTAYDQFALQAFDANAIDYLLKPYDEARFLRALQRVAERRASKVQTEQHLLLNEKGRVTVIRLADIIRFEAADNYVMIHTSQQQHMVRQTLSGLQEKLGQGFVRCHRSHIVRLDQITQVLPAQKGDAELVLQDGLRLPCSRQHRDEVVQALAS